MHEPFHFKSASADAGLHPSYTSEGPASIPPMIIRPFDCLLRYFFFIFFPIVWSVGMT
jgi:hypothetical protein